MKAPTSLEKLIKNNSFDLEFVPSDQECREKASRPQLNTLWGVSPAPPLHLGYDKTICLLRSMQSDNINLSIVIADMHAMLAQGLLPEQAQIRQAYYYTYLKYICGVKAAYLNGSSFQMQSNYIDLLYRLKRHVTISDVKQALPSATSKLQQTELSRLSTYTYTVMQVVDALYLDTDIIIADQGQKKIYELGTKALGAMNCVSNQIQEITNTHLKQSEYPPQIYTTLSHDTQGKPLNKSSVKTRISIHESEDSLKKKIHSMYLRPYDQPPAEGRHDVITDIFTYSVFPWLNDVDHITASDGQKFGSAEELNAHYLSGKIHPNDLKQTLFDHLHERLTRINEKMGTALLSWIDLRKIRGGHD